MGEQSRRVLRNGEVNTPYSSVPNGDRLLLSDEPVRINPAVTPRDVLSMFRKIKDTRLTAYIMGVTEKAVKQIAEGVLFPDDMMFPFSYVASVSGVEIRRLRRARRIEYPDFTTRNTGRLTSSQAKNIISRGTMLPSKDFSKEALAARENHKLNARKRRKKLRDSFYGTVEVANILNMANSKLRTFYREARIDIVDGRPLLANKKQIDFLDKKLIYCRREEMADILIDTGVCKSKKTAMHCIACRNTLARKFNIDAIPLSYLGVSLTYRVPADYAYIVKDTELEEGSNAKRSTYILSVFAKKMMETIDAVGEIQS